VIEVMEKKYEDHDGTKDIESTGKYNRVTFLLWNNKAKRIGLAISNASRHNHPIASTAARDRALRTPTEIWEKIFALLDLNDIRSVRLV
jgi:hypothetical protein